MTRQEALTKIAHLIPPLRVQWLPTRSNGDAVHTAGGEQLRALVMGTEGARTPRKQVCWFPK